MKTPHILLAAGNVSKMRANLAHLLDPAGLMAIDTNIRDNIVGLFHLGQAHTSFALSLPNAEWRQQCSRLYYGAYNVQRAIRLSDSGSYSTDSTDHKRVGSLPTGFPRGAIYEVQLPLLREDRNLCDYDHSADVSDLAIPLADARALVSDFLADASVHLLSKGITT